MRGPGALVDGVVVALVLALVGVARADAGSAPADGELLYRAHCAVCHGGRGRGDGPASVMLSPPPRDFTTGRYKFRSSPPGTPPLVGDLARTISEGLRGTSMPAYGGVLAPGEIEALARLLLSMAPAAARAAGAPPPPRRAVAAGAHAGDGEALFRAAGCVRCHGPEGRRDAAPAREGPGGSPPPPDLAEPWTFRRQGTGEVARRIITGIDGSAMPSYADSLSAEDAEAIERFVAAQAREPIWRARDPRAIAAAGVDADPVARGRYLVKAMMCPLCHTPISAERGEYDAARFLAGGMRVSAYPWGVWYSRNLTPDRDTGLGGWSEADVVRAVTTGVSRDGRRLDPMAMPWPWFSRLRPDDARAIAAFLARVPAVRNPVPPARRPWGPERAGGALLALLGADVAVEFWGGNAAAERALVGMPASSSHRAAASAIGLLTLVAPLVGVGLAVRRHRAGRAAACLVLTLGWIALATWPPLSLMSPDVAARWLFLGAPRPAEAPDAATRALVQRGEYLVTIAPCGLCHTPASPFVGFLTRRTLAGGMEARWRVYGTAVATNLTPHPTDGLPDDARVVRALETGLAHDGRRMHWQAMPWDLLSNWSEEDQRAMLAYLRALPSVPGRVPPPAPPRPDDPPADAFSFGDRARR